MIAFKPCLRLKNKKSDFLYPSGVTFTFIETIEDLRRLSELKISVSLKHFKIYRVKNATCFVYTIKGDDYNGN